VKLWLLRPRDDLPAERGVNPWEPWYDKCFGMVIRAESETAARLLAGRQRESFGNYVSWENACDEGGAAWVSEKFSTCVELSVDGDAEVIMRDIASA
jgi:hypothetical protein